jgi:hypothetical protein
VSVGREIGAAGLEGARNVVPADSAETIGLDRPSGRLHGGKQAIDQGVIELHAAVQKALQGGSLKPNGIEHGLALGCPRQTVELREEVTDQANAVATSAVGQEGPEQTLELCAAVPMRAGRG